MCWLLLLLSQTVVTFTTAEHIFVTKTIFKEGDHVNAPSSTQRLVLDKINGTIYPETLSELQDLQTLRIYFSHLDEIKPGALCQSPILRDISIGITLGELLNRDHFRGCDNLKSLEMKYFTVSMAPGVFKNLHNLKTLSTEQFEWGDLTKGLFSGLENVKKISITDGQVSRIEPGTFAELVNLEELVLTNNKLAVVHGNEFSGLSSLKVLNIDFNPTVSVDVDELLRSLPNTKSIIIPYFYYFQLSKDEQKSLSEKFERAGVREFYRN